MPEAPAVNVMPPVKNPNLPIRLRTLHGFGALIEGSQYRSFPIEIPSIPLDWIFLLYFIPFSFTFQKLGFLTGGIAFTSSYQKLLTGTIVVVNTTN